MSSSAKKLKEQNVEPASSHQMQVEADWNQRVLVVEDEVGILETYKDILLAEGDNVVPLQRSSRSSRSNQQVSAKRAARPQFKFELVTCKNPEEALAQVKKSIKEGRPFAMGFFDVMLGTEMDGFDLVKEIHELDPHLYAVFVTAFNDRSIDSIDKYLGEGLSNRWDYLNKPFTQGEIMQKARNFVSLWNLQAEKMKRDSQLAELNQQLLRKERLASVATVARGVGHEFGNLLMQIVGNADVARNKDEESMRKAFDKILDASQRANDILDRFKNLSEANEDTPPKRDDSVDHIVNEALSLMDHQFKTNNMKICKIKSDKVIAYVNSTAILQTVVNLSINSMYAMSKSGGQIDYSVVDHGDEYEICVRDYGPGIDPAIIANVCDAFFTTKGDMGTGLGLAICKEIVEIEHQGKFSLRNHEVMGLEVKMRMPKKMQDEGAKMAEVDLDLPVLVIDDDSMVREVIVNYMQEYGFTQIVEARTSTHALKLLNDPNFRVALVLSDWEMPDVNGLTLLKAIRTNPLRAHLRFIMVTSQRSMERFKITQAAKWQVNAYVVKPFRSDLLKEKVWRVMGWNVPGEDVEVDSDYGKIVIKNESKKGGGDWGDSEAS